MRKREGEKERGSCGVAGVLTAAENGRRGSVRGIFRKKYLPAERSITRRPRAW